MILYETLEISHSALTRSYYIISEPGGKTYPDEHGIDIDYQGVNFKISKNTSSDDLDEEIIDDKGVDYTERCRPILLIHGFSSDYTTWNWMAQKLWNSLSLAAFLK